MKRAEQKRTMRGVVVWGVIAALVTALTVAAAVWHREVASTWSRLTSSSSSAASMVPTLTPSSSPTPASPSPVASTSPSASAVPSVLAALGQPAAANGPAVDPKKLAALIAKVPNKDLGTVGAEVIDLASGKVLYSNGSAKPLMPASTQKTLTSIAALQTYGPEHTFSTSVVSPKAGTIVLVGGGDPFLRSSASSTYPYPATSADLAAKTAAKLKADKITSVVLGYDDSLFTGPSWNPTWFDGYHNQVTNVSSLWIDESLTARTNPAATAASTFATQLQAQGIKVSGTPARMSGQAKSAEVASVQSMPLSTIVEQTLLHSDNSAAEVLLRQVALGNGQPGSFVGGTTAAHEVLTKLGIWTTNDKLVDGSGLSRSNRVTASTLAAAIHQAAVQPALRPVLEGLPVAWVTGTLNERFIDADSAAGRGVVHAKSGTLTHVSSYAGYTTTTSGRVLGFAFVINGADPEAPLKANSPGINDWNMRLYLDQVTSALSTCGCS